MTASTRGDDGSRARDGACFALLSPCGHGNLGDAAIQEAVIRNLRRRSPGAKFIGITLRPLDTERRHGIPAHPIASRSQPGYGVVPKGQDEGAAGRKPAERGTRGPEIAHRTPSVLPPSLRLLLRAVLPKGWGANIRRELRHIRDAVRLLRRVDTLVVSGGGQLDDYWGGPWGHPYALAKWTLLARLMGRRVVVLSVGFGSLDSRASRFFTRCALHMAHYRSYRDDGSRQRMRAAGFGAARRDPVVPDLAFSLTRDGADLAPTRPAAARIGISPMAYCDPRVWPTKDTAIYQTHLQRLAALTVELAKAGHSVSFFASDGPDHRAVSELLEIVRPQVRSDAVPDVPPSKTLDEFMNAAAEMDIVVASRLHGVVLSQLVGTPVVALSYDRKVGDLMHALRQASYCLDIETSEVDEISRTLHALASRLEDERANVRERLAVFRRQLDPQYDLVVNSQ